MRKFFLELLIRIQNILAPPAAADEVRRQIAKTDCYKALAALQRAEAISVLSEIISENVYARADLEAMKTYTRDISEIAAALDASSFMLLLSQGLYQYVETKVMPNVKQNNTQNT